MKAYLSYGAIAAAFAAGWYFNGLKHDSEALTAERQQKAIESVLESAVSRIAEETNKSISNIRVENKTIVNEVRHEILKEPVYTECVLTNDGLHLANKARLKD